MKHNTAALIVLAGLAALPTPAATAADWGLPLDSGSRVPWASSLARVSTTHEQHGQPAVAHGTRTVGRQSLAVHPSDWSAELAQALSLYRAGDYLAAQDACAARLASSHDGRVRSDAIAIQAMILMRMPARNARLDGRAQLAALSLDDPSLAERPECLLALGLAHTSLAETAKALDCLDRAAAGFDARGEHARLAETLAALAAAWSSHTEWEMTPSRFDVSQPRNSDEARQLRREQMGRIRDRLASMPQSDDAVARVDLLLAEDFIAAGDRTDDGLRTLEQIAASPSVTPAVADALEKLAQHCEDQQRWSDALALYGRLAAEGPAAAARRAEDRMTQITRPQLSIEVPATTSANEPVDIRLAVRNVAAVQVEIRHVALGDWLSAHQGRFAEALLPEAGSVQMARHLDTRAEHEHGWWRSEQQTETVQFRAPPGAYVVIVTPEGAQAVAHCVKRLAIVSDLTATAVVGPDHAAICVTPEAPELRARFWMHGSFVATEPRFDRGIARFPLPAEAHVLRDKRWVCLIEAGQDLALCRGELRSASATPLPTVALLGAPAAPRVGGELDPRRPGAARFTVRAALRRTAVADRDQRRDGAPRLHLPRRALAGRRDSGTRASYRGHGG